MKDLNHIKRLFRFLGENGRAVEIDDDIYVALKSSLKILMTEHEQNKDQFNAGIWWKKGGEMEIRINSWMESHHNGDPYSESNRTISLWPPYDNADEKFGEGDYGKDFNLHDAFKAIESDLESQALFCASKLYDERKQKEKEDLVREFLFDKLGY